MKTREQVRIHIRWMVRRDLPEVIEIENQCSRYPWTDADYLNHLRQNSNISMVAEHDDRVIGCMCYELHKREIELHRLVVRPDWQRRGVGSQMIQRLRRKLLPRQRYTLETIVRESDLGTQLFLRAVGLRAMRVLRNCYDDTAEAGYEFVYQVNNQSTGRVQQEQ